MGPHGTLRCRDSRSLFHFHPCLLPRRRPDARRLKTLATTHKIKELIILRLSRAQLSECKQIATTLPVKHNASPLPFEAERHLLQVGEGKFNRWMTFGWNIEGKEAAAAGS